MSPVPIKKPIKLRGRALLFFLNTASEWLQAWRSWHSHVQQRKSEEEEEHAEWRLTALQAQVQEQVQPGTPSTTVHAPNMVYPPT